MKRPGLVLQAPNPGPNQMNPIVEGFEMARSSLPSTDLLRQLISYDPATGRLTWLPRTAATISEFGSTERARNSWNGKYSGKLADCTMSGNGYRAVCVFNHRMLAHRVAWAISTGSWPSQQIDHINGIRTDNRMCNLRDVDAGTNGRNRTLRSDNKSGISGIWRQKPKAWGGAWAVVTSEGGRIIRKKSFKCLGEAIRYRNADLVSRGFTGRHGCRA